MRNWQRRHRKQVRAYNAAWKAANPEKVKAHKKKAAKKYAIRRRMLYKARTPERKAEDNRKQRERHHRRYPNRSPEQVKKDKERSRDKYQKFLAMKLQAERIIAQGKLAMPHRKPQDERAALVNQLYNDDKKWPAIQKQVEQTFNIHTTVKALQELRKRYVDRLERMNKAS